jgi:hypothetical protein
MIETRPVCWACRTEFWGAGNLWLWDIILDMHTDWCPDVRHKMLNISEDARTFRFPSVGEWMFKWEEGRRLVYVFRSCDSSYAQEAVAIQHDEELSYENAQAAAKRWVQSRYAFGTPEFNAARPAPKRRTSGANRLVDSVPYKTEEVVRSKAELLVAVTDGMLSLEQAATRLRVMAGDLKDDTYEQQLNQAFAELARMYGSKSSEPVRAQEDDGVPF